MPLLERVSGRWQTTAAGAIFYGRAREMLALVDQTERDLAAAAGHIRDA
jgi:DNA-binding transcriptional LysR family regulator